MSQHSAYGCQVVHHWELTVGPRDAAPAELLVKRYGQTVRFQNPDPAVQAAS